MDKSLLYEMARPEETDEIFSLYTSATANLNKRGIYQWDDIYPDAEIIRTDIVHQHMYTVKKAGRIIAAFAVCDESDPEYCDGIWSIGTYTVLHRFCISPEYQNKGYGKTILSHIEAMLKEKRIDYLRLDAFLQNPFSIRLYEKQGYSKTGVIHVRKGLFALYEKHL